MIQGNIDISQFNNWHRLLEYTPHKSPLSGFKFFDPNDQFRYNPDFILAHIHQGIDNEKEKFFKEQFPKLNNPLFAIQKMSAGMMLPYHSDEYAYFLRTNPNTTIDRVCRLIVFLEDWQPGHYFEGMDRPYTDWRAGFTVEWPYNTPHMAANMGLTPRYTLQITGHVDD
jgi:hypothetical protein